MHACCMGCRKEMTVTPIMSKVPTCFGNEITRAAVTCPHCKVVFCIDDNTPRQSSLPKREPEPVGALADLSPDCL
jgi:hypothetical protein